MKGYVPTPETIVDSMVAKLFAGRPPKPTDVVLDPGCGRGEFIAGVLRWCEARGLPVPTIVGVENDPRHWAPAHSRFLGNRRVKIRRRDFLKLDSFKYEFIIGNPPYVPITELSSEEKERYRNAGYSTASGRMDLYMLFFEAAINRLREGGRLVFVTPEKFLYVATAAPLRKILASLDVESIELLPEDAFPGLTTYPAVTTVTNRPPHDSPVFLRRDGKRTRAKLPGDGSSWLPGILGYNGRSRGLILDDISLRISAGIATGADSVFVIETQSVAPQLSAFAYPTISGRDLKPGLPLPKPSRSMLVPYTPKGRLRDPEEAHDLLSYLAHPVRRSRLIARTCAQRKPWYAFHDSAPLDEIRRPKIVWKDISEGPAFWVDRSGALVPRHSVYYLVPKDATKIDQIRSYLSSEKARAWIAAHCQRAANGFLRLQCNVLREMPIPPELASEA